MPAHAATAFRLALLIFSWLPVPTFAADVRVTLPLEGHFRPGRYMPLRVDVRGAPADARLRLTAEGAVPTDIVLSDGRANGIVPLLPIDENARQLRWSMGDDSGVVEAPLRAMNPDERLVGFASDVDPALAQRLFPEARITVVRVDADLTISNAVAWQALDAVVVPAEFIAADRSRSFVSAGMAVVVVASDDEPRGTQRLPWQQFDGYRVLRHDAFGPDRAGVSAAAFAPVQGWQAELPRAMRNRLLLFGVLVVVLLLAATLLPRKIATIVVIVICVASAWSMNRWWRTRSPTLERLGSVYVRDTASNQHDLWTYRTARGPVSGERSFLMTWPILERPGDVRATSLRLECDSRGAGAFRYDLTRGQKIAFMTRSVTFSPMPSAGPIAERGESPMDRLAQKLYLRPSYRIVAPEYPITDEGPGLLRDVYPTAVVAPVRDGG